MLTRILFSQVTLSIFASAAFAAPQTSPAIPDQSGPVIAKPVVTSSPVASAVSPKVKPETKPAAKPAPAKSSAIAAPKAAPAKSAAVKPARNADGEVMKAQMEKLLTMVGNLETKLNSIEQKIDGVPAEPPVTEAPTAPVEKQVFTSSDEAELRAPAQPTTQPPAQPAAQATVAPAPTAPVSNAKIFEGQHRSFDTGSWTFDASGYTLRCQSSCPALHMIDQSKPLAVNASSGVIEFQTQVGPRSCQVSRCAAVR